MSTEIILTPTPLGDYAEKTTNWTLPVFMRDGEWHVGFGVDIFSFALSS